MIKDLLMKKLKGNSLSNSRMKLKIVSIVKKVKLEKKKKKKRRKI